MIAAAFLEWTKDSIRKKSGDKKVKIPEVIFNHPWYMYVDPEIKPSHLTDLTLALNDELEFLDKVFTSTQESDSSSSNSEQSACHVNQNAQ